MCLDFLFAPVFWINGVLCKMPNLYNLKQDSQVLQINISPIVRKDFFIWRFKKKILIISDLKPFVVFVSVLCRKLFTAQLI